MSSHTLEKLLILVITLSLSGCAVSNPADIEIVSKATNTLTAVPVSDTPVPRATPTGTPTPVLATFTPFPATVTPEAPDLTVCQSGCSYSSVQAAVDASGQSGPVVIEILDPIHTEAGILIREGDSVVIRGAGPDRTILQAHESLAGSPDRVILIEKGGEAVLQGLTIRHGRPAVEKEHGGGVNNYGKLTIVNCLISDNSARGGGGISSRQAELEIIDSTISGNTARGDGPRGEECGGGGGVKCSSGRMKIVNSTVAENIAGTQAEGLGGGIRVGCSCDAEIINSTVFNNQAVRYGSGIAAAGVVKIIHTTIVGNQVNRANGGALWVRGEVSLLNSLITNNSGGMDCVIHTEGLYGGSLIVNDYNLVSDGSCQPFLSAEAGLGSPGFFGGLTETIPLLPDSRAVDAVPPEACSLAADQRGEHRGVILFRPESPCDIGAYELLSP